MAASMVGHALPVRYPLPWSLCCIGAGPAAMVGLAVVVCALPSLLAGVANHGVPNPLNAISVSTPACLADLVLAGLLLVC